MSFDDFYKLSQMNCHYCGEAPSNIQNSSSENGSKASQYAKDNGDFIYNGLDRLDSNLLHTLENCVSCCMHCNYAKRDRTLEDFKKWIKQIYNHFNVAEK